MSNSVLTAVWILAPFSFFSKLQVAPSAGSAVIFRQSGFLPRNFCERNWNISLWFFHYLQPSLGKLTIFSKVAMNQLVLWKSAPGPLLWQKSLSNVWRQFCKNDAEKNSFNEKDSSKEAFSMNLVSIFNQIHSYQALLKSFYEFCQNHVVSKQSSRAMPSMD